MSDSFVTIMLILISAVMLFMVPMVAISHRKDVVATQTVQTAINEFVDSARKTGKITQEEFSNLIQTIETTGEKYEVNININNIDENPSKKDTSSVTDQVKIGENIYYTEYTAQVEEKLEQGNGEIKLSAGDFVTVDVENVSQTMYQNFKSFLYNVVDSTTQISGTYGGMILDENSQVDVSYNEEAEKVTLTYNKNSEDENICWGSTQWIENKIVEKDKNTNIDIQDTKTIHRPGFKCTSWKKGSSNSSEIVAGGDTILLQSNITLYANWTNMSDCNIYYNANIENLTNANITNIPETQSVKYDEEATISGKEPRDANSNYKFMGWSKDKTAFYGDYNLGATLERVTEDITLYAVWGLTENNLRYMKNTDKQVIVFPEETVTGVKGEEITITDKKPERRDGIKFLGWSRNADDNEAQYNAGDKITLNGKITLYAIWAEEIEVVFDGNGGTVNYQGISSETISTNNIGPKIYIGNSITLPNATREGRTFLGWSTSKNATVVNDSNMKEGGTFKPTDDQTYLYAVWSSPEREYTIIFHGNGGKVEYNGESSDTLERSGIKNGTTITLPKATRDNYKFLGWSTNKNATSIGTGDIKYDETTGRGNYTVTADKEFWAVWQYSIRFSVTYDKNTTDTVSNMPQDKRNLDSKLYPYGFPVPDDPTREGYTFYGWTLEGDKTANRRFYAGNYVDIEENIKLIANWEKTTYTISYNKNTNDTVLYMPANQTVNHGVDYLIPNTIPVRDKYIFVGWSTSSNGNDKIYNPEEIIYFVNKHTKLYAIWKYNEQRILTLTGSKPEYYNAEEKKTVNVMLIEESNVRQKKETGNIVRNGEFKSSSKYTSTGTWNINDVNEMKLDFVPKKITYTFYVKRKSCVESRDMRMVLEASTQSSGDYNWVQISDTETESWGWGTIWTTREWKDVEDKEVKANKLKAYKRYRVRFYCDNDMSDREKGLTTIEATIKIYS